MTQEFKVLVVDDEPDIVRYLEHVLHRLGYRTASAGDHRARWRPKKSRIRRRALLTHATSCRRTFARSSRRPGSTGTP